MARKTQAEMVEALRQQLAEAEAKAEAKGMAARAKAADEIDKIDDRLTKAEATLISKVAELTDAYNALVVKLGARRAELVREFDGSFDDVVVEDAAEATFTELTLDEV